jgi:hypothetical protein
MADGKQRRWGDSPKHLITISGETLLQRTVRLLKYNGVTDIWITTHNPDYAIDGVKLFYPQNNEEEIDKFYSNREIWDNETILLYGDVYFSESGIKQIVEIPGHAYTFFGRSGPNKISGKAWGEMFAVKFCANVILEAACLHIRNGVKTGNIDRGGAWELYRYMVYGIPGDSKTVVILNGHFHEIDDETDDFDSPEDYDNWCKGIGINDGYFD